MMIAVSLNTKALCGHSARITAAVCILASFGVSAADSQAGENVFKQCSACHEAGPDASHRFGPQLNGILSRGAGNADGYTYSAALNDRVSAGLTWDEDTLDAYLKAPLTYMPGTKMAYVGLQDEVDRDNVIAYLATINLDGSASGDSSDDAASSAVADSSASGPAAEAAPRPLAIDVPIPTHGVLHLGRPATEEEVAAWDIDIRPDGKGLPPGKGSVLTGVDIYDAQCASCHGVFGEGEGRWPILAGGFDTLTDARPEKTIGSYWPYLSTVYDYVRRAMPFGNSRSLSDDDVYALTAYLLYLNDLVDESFELTDQNFAQVRLPNEGNFIADNRDEESWFGAAQEACMNDCIEGPARVMQRARVLDVTPDSEDEDGGGTLD